LSTKMELPGAPLPAEVQQLVLLETLRELLTAAIRSLSRGEPGELAATSRDINATAGEVLAASRELGRLPLTPEARQRRQSLLAELRRQRSFCRAMLRRWRRSILAHQQLLDLATGTATYGETPNPQWSSHE